MGELCFFMSTRRILLLLVSLFASVAMMAQNVNVTVKLTDASNDEPIGFATVSLTPEKGSAKYSLTDNNGKGTIEATSPMRRPWRSRKRRPTSAW